MLKATALEGFWPVNVFKSKRQPLLKANAKHGDEVLRFRLSIFLILVNIMLLLSYVYGVNDLASKGYTIKSLQAKHSQVAEENKKFSVEVAELSSIVNVQNGPLMANFVPAGTPKYLEVELNHFTQR